MKLEYEFKSLAEFVREMDYCLGELDEACEEHGPLSYDVRDWRDAIVCRCKCAIDQKLIPETVDVNVTAYLSEEDKKNHKLSRIKKPIGITYDDYPEEVYWMARKKLESMNIDWMNRNN